MPWFALLLLQLPIQWLPDHSMLCCKSSLALLMRDHWAEMDYFIDWLSLYSGGALCKGTALTIMYRIFRCQDTPLSWRYCFWFGLAFGQRAVASSSHPTTMLSFTKGTPIAPVVAWECSSNHLYIASCCLCVVWFYSRMPSLWYVWLACGILFSILTSVFVVGHHERSMLICKPGVGRILQSTWAAGEQIMLKVEWWKPDFVRFQASSTTNWKRSLRRGKNLTMQDYGYMTWHGMWRYFIKEQVYWDGYLSCDLYSVAAVWLSISCILDIMATFQGGRLLHSYRSPMAACLHYVVNGSQRNDRTFAETLRSTTIMTTPSVLTYIDTATLFHIYCSFQGEIDCDRHKGPSTKKPRIRNHTWGGWQVETEKEHLSCSVANHATIPCVRRTTTLSRILHSWRHYR